MGEVFAMVARVILVVDAVADDEGDDDEDVEMGKLFS